MALPATANFIDPLRLGLVKAARLPRGRASGYGSKLWLRKGHSVTELTLSADRWVSNYDLSGCLEGRAASMGSGETDQPSGGCRFAWEAEILRCRKYKILYLLIFMSRASRAHFSIALVKPR